MAGRYAPQDWVKQPSPTLSLNLFTKELLNNAIIPTPAPYLLLAGSAGQVDLAQAEASSIPPLPTSTFST